MNDRYHRAAKDGLIDVLKEATRLELNKAEDDGMTPTLWSAYHGNLDGLQVCLKRGGDPNKCDLTGNTPLHLAAQNGHLHCVSFLVAYGVNLWKYDNDYHTAKDVAGIRNQLDCVRSIDKAMSQQLTKDPKKVKNKQEAARKEAQERIKKFEAIREKEIRKRDSTSKKFSSGNVTRPAPQKTHGSLRKYFTTIGRKKPLSVPKGIEEVKAEIDENPVDFVPSVDSNVIYKQTDEMKDLIATDDASNRRPAVQDIFPGEEDNDRPVDFTAKGFTFDMTSNRFGTFRGFNISGSLYDVLPTERQTSEKDEDAIVPDIVRPEMPKNESDASSEESVEEEEQSELDLFLSGLGLSDWAPLFTSSEVDMEALKLCSDADLTEMGLTVGPRVKIRNALQKMQETEEKWTDSDLTEF